MVKLIRLKHLFISGCLLFAGLNNSALSESLPLWEQKDVQLQQQRDAVFGQVEELHTALLVRAELEDPSLLTRLSPEPPKARASGYGLLPLLKENDPVVAVEPTQTLYSLQWLEGRLHAEQQNTGKMLEQVSDSTELEDVLTRYEESIKRLWNLEDSLSYHAKWQKAVVQYPAYYQKKNELIVQARELSSLIDHDASALQVAEVRNQLLKRAAPFRPTRNLQVTMTVTGEVVLPITMCTDIEDSIFLSAFKGGVE